VTSCAEGAIRIIDGKARLVSDKYCDGLGACLGECPQDALSFEEREAEEFDEHAVTAHLGATALLADENHKVAAPAHHAGGGCPGSRMFSFDDVEDEPASDGTKQRSQLRQWPVKLSLLNPTAPYLRDADLVLAADCAAFAYGSFHPDFLKGKALAIGCPKLDDVQHYIDKLTAIIRQGGIKSIQVVHMEVPCCMGLLYVAKEAVRASGQEIPVTSVVLSIRGNIA
jgi:NAD-dependent dihydropyrimidine dehydrogenase PreA subunit